MVLLRLREKVEKAESAGVQTLVELSDQQREREPELRFGALDLLGGVAPARLPRESLPQGLAQLCQQRFEVRGELHHGRNGYVCRGALAETERCPLTGPGQTRSRLPPVACCVGDQVVSSVVLVAPGSTLIWLAGDIIEQPIDVLVCTANVWGNLSGGVNGALLARAGVIVQHELHAAVRASGRTFVEPGTILRTSAGPLSFHHVLHAVAVDAFYKTSEALVASLLVRCLEQAAGQGARSVALPALATGYGRMPLAIFGRALREAWDAPGARPAEVRIVLRTERDREEAELGFANAKPG